MMREAIIDGRAACKSTSQIAQKMAARSRDLIHGAMASAARLLRAAPRT